MSEYSNHLINETSPYLLQHAHNPVNWYPWSEEALERAKKEDKPILVSIGYSACHWCHVMERESFEDEHVGEVMNREFINIKIDREERPDLDHIYMDALQAMTGSGGWPLNVFLTPDRKPFYGGTYFPPRPVHNRPSWKDVLQGISQAWKERRDEIEEQATQMINHLENANNIGTPITGLDQLKGKSVIDKLQLKEMRNVVMQSADRVWGGFGHAPKFPQTFLIRFLLMYDHLFGDYEALQQAKLSLNKMIQGGIYDQVAGGFARYSTDTEWLAPHFEKMTYDNALLSIVLADAYKITGDSVYADVLEETLLFMVNDMMNEEGGFYAALDADSEGVEGKYYIWTKEEFAEIVGEDSKIVGDLFDITETGNWENANIPFMKLSLADFASKHSMSPELLKEKKKKAQHQLLQHRKNRVPPGLDDKCILGWNALMNIALTNAYAATGNIRWREFAEMNMQFMVDHFQNKATGNWYHTFKNGLAKYPAFLDDLAYLVSALIRLNEIGGDSKWLELATGINKLIIEEFSDTGSAMFYFTGKEQQDVVLRKKEWYDGAVPSGNAIMADNLRRLGILTNRADWTQRSVEMVVSLREMILRYPNSFGIWACLLMEEFAGTMEILILGDKAEEYARRVLKTFIPNRIFQFAKQPELGNPLHDGKGDSKETFLYLCRDYSCLKPVKNPEEFFQMVEMEKIS